MTWYDMIYLDHHPVGHVLGPLLFREPKKVAMGWNFLRKLPTSGKMSPTCYPHNKAQNE